MTIEALQARVSALASKQRSEAERNRERAPEFAAFVDDLRRVFGSVRVTWVRFSDETEIGKRWEPN